MLFSVLIPVYNAEDYIEETIQSVLNQTEQDFELVLLDDESTDHSREICKRLSEEHPDKIRFYRQKNTGVLFARRKLAELAKGKYLWYVDADDLIDYSALQRIKDSLLVDLFDLVIIDIQKTAIDGDERYTLPFENNQTFRLREKASIYCELLKTKYLNGIYQKIFKRDCFDFDGNYDNVRNMRIAEDIYQSIPILDKADTIAYIKEPLYIYRKNSSGATSSVKLSDLQWDYKLYDRQDEYIEKWQIADEDRQIIAENRMRRILSFLSVYAKQKTDDAYKQFKAFAAGLKDNSYYIAAKEKAAVSHLQKIYNLDLLLLKLHFYRMLFQLHKRI